MRRALIPIKGEVVVSEPKTAKGRRVIALDPFTVEVLKAQAARQLDDQREWKEAWVETGLVFTLENGEALDPEDVSRYFRQAVKKAMLPQIRLHDLRHTHATLALQAGVHPKVVSERLGHATVSITLDTYSHAIPAMQEEAAVADRGAGVRRRIAPPSQADPSDSSPTRSPPRCLAAGASLGGQRPTGKKAACPARSRPSGTCVYPAHGGPMPCRTMFSGRPLQAKRSRIRGGLAVMGHCVVALGTPSRTYASGRVCAAPGCSARLSIYNSLAYCALHRSQQSRRLATRPRRHPKRELLTCLRIASLRLSLLHGQPQEALLLRDLSPGGISGARPATRQLLMR